MNSGILRYSTYSIIIGLIIAILSIGCSQRGKSLGNVYRYPMVTRVKGFDPALGDDIYSHISIKQVYETLLQYHHLKRPYELVPLLAESMPTISEDGLTYTFTLKKGVYFQDDPCFKGEKREFVAEDLIYSIKRVADIKTKSTGWWIFDGRIRGLDEFRKESQESETTDYTRTVEGLQAPDKYTFVLTLTQPCSQMLYFFTMSYTSVVPKEAVDHYGEEFLNHPVGTGPYKLSEWRKGLRLVFTKNPEYRKEHYPSEGSEEDKEAGLLDDAGKELPFIDTLIFNVYVESQPQWLNFMQGNIEVTGIPKDNYNQAINPDKSLKNELADKEINLNINPSLDVTYTFFNMEDKTLGSNVHLRRAFCYAWDIDKNIKLMFNDRAIPAHSPVPPGLVGYDPDFVNPYQKFDPALAKKELEKAGFPGGKRLPTFEYLSNDNTTARQWSEKFVKEMGDVGIKITVTSVTWPEFLNRIKNKKFQIAGMAWSADYPDPENFMQLLYGPNEAPGTNNANYKNATYDKLYEELLKTTDDEQKSLIIKKMKDIFAEDCPWIPGVHRLAFGLSYSWVKNRKYNDISPGNFKYLRIDIDKRNELLKGK